jgi:hypothetical protein
MSTAVRPLRRFGAGSGPIMAWKGTGTNSAIRSIVRPLSQTAVQAAQGLGPAQRVLCEWANDVPRSAECDVVSSDTPTFRPTLIDQPRLLLDGRAASARAVGSSGAGRRGARAAAVEVADGEGRSSLPSRLGSHWKVNEPEGAMMRAGQRSPRRVSGSLKGPPGSRQSLVEVGRSRRRGQRSSRGRPPPLRPSLLTRISLP